MLRPRLAFSVLQHQPYHPFLLRGLSTLTPLRRSFSARDWKVQYLSRTTYSPPFLRFFSGSGQVPKTTSPTIAGRMLEGYFQHGHYDQVLNIYKIMSAVSVSRAPSSVESDAASPSESPSLTGAATQGRITSSQVDHLIKEDILPMIVLSLVMTGRHMEAWEVLDDDLCKQFLAVPEASQKLLDAIYRVYHADMRSPLCTNFAVEFLRYMCMHRFVVDEGVLRIFLDILGRADVQGGRNEHRGERDSKKAKATELNLISILKEYGYDAAVSMLQSLLAEHSASLLVRETSPPATSTNHTPAMLVGKAEGGLPTKHAIESSKGLQSLLEEFREPLDVVVDPTMATEVSWTGQPRSTSDRSRRAVRTQEQATKLFSRKMATGTINTDDMLVYLSICLETGDVQAGVRAYNDITVTTALVHAPALDASAIHDMGIRLLVMRGARPDGSRPHKDWRKKHTHTFTTETALDLFLSLMTQDQQRTPYYPSVEVLIQLVGSSVISLLRKDKRREVLQIVKVEVGHRRLPAVRSTTSLPRSALRSSTSAGAIEIDNLLGCLQAVLDAYVQLGDFFHAQEVLAIIEETSAFMVTLPEALLSQGKRTDMHTGSFRLTACFNAVIGLCLQQDRPAEGSALLLRMRSVTAEADHDSGTNEADTNADAVARVTSQTIDDFGSATACKRYIAVVDARSHQLRGLLEMSEQRRKQSLRAMVLAYDKMVHGPGMQGTEPTMEHFYLMMRRSNSVRYAQGTFQAFSMLQQKGLSPDAAIFAELAEAHASCGDLAEAQQALVHMKGDLDRQDLSKIAAGVNKGAALPGLVRNRCRDVELYVTAKGGDENETRRLLHVEKGGLSRRMIAGTYHNKIDRSAEKTIVGKWATAPPFLDNDACAAFIRGLEESRLENAVEIMSLLREALTNQKLRTASRRQKVSTTLPNQMRRGSSKGAADVPLPGWSDADVFPRKLLDRILTLYVRANRPDLCFSLLGELDAREVTVSEKTVRALIEALQSDQVSLYLPLFFEHVLAQANAKAERSRSRVATAADHKRGVGGSVGVGISSATYSTVLRAACSSGSIPLAAQLFRQMAKQKNLVLESHAYCAYVALLSNNLAWSSIVVQKRQKDRQTSRLETNVLGNVVAGPDTMRDAEMNDTDGVGGLSSLDLLNTKVTAPVHTPSFLPSRSSLSSFSSKQPERQRESITKPSMRSVPVYAIDPTSDYIQLCDEQGEIPRKCFFRTDLVESVSAGMSQPASGTRTTEAAFVQAGILLEESYKRFRRIPLLLEGDARLCNTLLRALALFHKDESLLELLRIMGVVCPALAGEKPPSEVQLPIYFDSAVAILQVCQRMQDDQLMRAVLSRVKVPVARTGIDSMDSSVNDSIGYLRSDAVCYVPNVRMKRRRFFQRRVIEGNGTKENTSDHLNAQQPNEELPAQVTTEGKDVADPPSVDLLRNVRMWDAELKSAFASTLPTSHDSASLSFPTEGHTSFAFVKVLERMKDHNVVPDSQSFAIILQGLHLVPSLAKEEHVCNL